MDCTVCKKTKQPTKDLRSPCFSCDGCRNLICAECSELSASEVRCMILQKRTLEYKCKKCKNFDTFNLLQNGIHDKEKIIQDQEEIIRLLKEKISGLEQNYAAQPTFAEVLKEKKDDRKLENIPPLVIKPKIHQDTKITQEDIRRYVKPSEIKVGIKNMHTAKMGSVVIKCSSKQEIDALKLAVSETLGERYEVRIPELRKPRVKIVGYKGQLNEVQIEQAIRRQNDWICDSDRLSVKYLKQWAQKDTATIYAECSATLFHKMIQKSKICIGWERFSVFEDLDVPKCFKCQGFFHKSSTCVNKRSCSICTEDHDRKDCPNLTKKCQSCKIANDKFNTKYDLNHSSSDKDCPSLKYHMDSLRSRINYYE